MILTVSFLNTISLSLTLIFPTTTGTIIAANATAIIPIKQQTFPIFETIDIIEF